MYGGMVKLVALPGRKRELLDFLSWDAEVARTSEPGTLRFDVWEVPDEPDAVYLYEAYADVPNVIEAPVFVVPFTTSSASIADA